MEDSSKMARSGKGARRGNARRAAGLTLVAVLTLAAVSMVLERVPPQIFEGRSEPAPAPDHGYPGETPRYFGMDPLELYEIYENELSRWEVAQSANNATTADATDAPTAPDAARSTPTRLKIPTIDLDIKVTKSGTDEVDLTTALSSAGENSVSWYEPGPSPGEAGSAVIVGKVADADGENDPSAFSQLRKLRLGDEIEVEREDGEAVRFLVETVRVCPASLPAELLDGEPEAAHLHVVACGDGATDNGVVISANLVNDEAPDKADDDGSDADESARAEDEDEDKDKDKETDDAES